MKKYESAAHTGKILRWKLGLKGLKCMFIQKEQHDGEGMLFPSAKRKGCLVSHYLIEAFWVHLYSCAAVAKVKTKVRHLRDGEW